MEYALIITLQLLGIGFHVMQKIVSLGDAFPNEQPFGIVKVFLKQDWDTLIVSFLVLVLNIVAHFIFTYYDAPFTKWDYYIFTSYGISLIFGYAGQRLIYKYFGTAEKYLDKKVTEKFG